MQKSANEVMQAILFAAVIDGIVALKDASKGMPNTLLRDLQTVHPNTTYDDLPKELQASIAASVREAFTRLLREGYAVAPSQPGGGGGPRLGPAGGPGAGPAGRGLGGGRGPGSPPPRPRGSGPRPPRGDAPRKPRPRQG